MTLRARLLIALVALLAAGIIACDVIAVTALRSYLFNQVDSDLVSSRNPVLARVGPAQTSQNIPRGGFGLTDYYVQIFDANGNFEQDVPATLRGKDDPAPAVTLDVLQGHTDGSPFNVDSVTGGDVQYRTIILQNTVTGEIFAVSAPLAGIDRTVDRLVAIEILVTVVMMTILAALGYLIIRRDLQPLEDMTATAGAIGAGDLTRRIDRADDHTEVGRLGLALNGMLSQIEASFAERQASEDRLRRFAADASHELRTPLTAVRGYAEMYRQGAVQPGEHLDRVMGRIESEATRMGSMVNDLLLLARLDQGRPLAYEPVELNAIVTNVVADASAVQPDRPITAHPMADPVIVNGDGARLQQVVANLVSNALSHTPAGTPVAVSVSVEDDFAAIAVQDQGQGISAEAIDKVFERFYRVDAGRARADGGTGLGLAIVKSLVEAHGGSVDVVSVEGAGATFTIHLPVARQLGPAVPV